MSSVERNLIRSPNWLGDAIMALPALQAWQDQRSSDGETLLLTRPALAPFWKMIPWVDQIVPLDDNLIVTATALRPLKIDTALIIPNSPRTALEVWLAGIPRRIGFTGSWRRHLLTHSMERPPQKGPPHHQSRDLLELLKSADWIDPETVPPVVSIPKPEPFHNGGDYLLVCPGAEYGPAKRWPARRFGQVANKLSELFSLQIVIAGGENDVESARITQRELPGKVTDLTGKTNLDEFLSLCAHARCVLTNDSGAMHAATLFGTPGVALFGSTEPRWTGPIHPAMRVVQEDVPCNPCFLRECPIDFRCMEQITVEQVLKTCREILNH